MKVCIFSHAFLPNIGGAQLVMHNLANALVDIGHDVMVLTSQHGARNIHLNTNYKLDTFSLPPRGGTKLRGDMLMTFFSLIKEKIRRRFDVLHTHFAYPSGYFSVKIKNLINSPVVITPHGQDIQKIPEINYGMRLDPVLEKKIKYVLQNADAITAISESIKNDIIDCGARKDIIYSIPNGINIKDFTNFQKDVREMLKLPENSKVILTVGRNHPKKAYADLIRAMALVVKTYPLSKCVIIGRDTESLVPLIKDFKIEDTIILAGEIPSKKDGKETNAFQFPHPDLVSIYKTSDIFVSSAIVEGLSLVSLEAMAAGLPIIATDVHGNRDIVQNGVNGFLVKPKDYHQMADKIKELLENEELKKKLSSGSSKLSKNYDWKHLAKRYIEVYMEAIARYKSLKV